MGMAALAPPRERLEERWRRAHEARGLLRRGSSSTLGAGLQAELALVRNHGIDAVPGAQLDDGRVMPARRSCRVLVQEVPARQHLQLVHRNGKDEQHLRRTPALLPLNLAHLVGVEVDLEAAEHRARRRAHHEEGFLSTDALPGALAVARPREVPSDSGLVCVEVERRACHQPRAMLERTRSRQGRCHPWWRVQLGNCGRPHSHDDGVAASVHEAPVVPPPLQPSPKPI